MEEKNPLELLKQAYKTEDQPDNNGTSNSNNKESDNASPLELMKQGYNK